MVISCFDRSIYQSRIGSVWPKHFSIIDWPTLWQASLVRLEWFTINFTLTLTKEAFDRLVHLVLNESIGI